jgi:DNA-binding NarL/FixJ family response regulator
MSEPASSSVLIVDDHPLTGEGLAAYLRFGGFQVAGCVGAVERVTGKPDVIVCDLRLPGRCGAEGVRHLVEQGHAVLAFSGVAKTDEVLDVIAAGARGFLSKTAQPRLFAEAIALLAGGYRYVSAELALDLLADAERRRLRRDDPGEKELELLRQLARGESLVEIANRTHRPLNELHTLLSRVWSTASERRALGKLTPRELEAVKLAALGKSHKEIATLMDIAPGTIVDHLTNARGKLVAVDPTIPPDTTPLAAARLWVKRLGVDT